MSAWTWQRRNIGRAERAYQVIMKSGLSIEVMARNNSQARYRAAKHWVEAGYATDAMSAIWHNQIILSCNLVKTP